MGGKSTSTPTPTPVATTPTYPNEKDNVAPVSAATKVTATTDDKKKSDDPTNPTYSNSVLGA